MPKKQAKLGDLSRALVTLEKVSSMRESGHKGKKFIEVR